MSVEERVSDAVNVLVTIVEAGGAIIIGVGAAYAFGKLLWLTVRDRDTASFVLVRLDLGRFLTLGLEFQLAGDILRTAISPSFSDIGQLAAIAAIRTALNWTLRREIDEERRQVAAGQRDDRSARP
ncbi:hypothetical protein Ais01nite_06860 [Asanoa ishikariensis]|uniref:Uncharacterized membrane protein n=1 Tax=Asanoa ishikariensis TaxID=137265 RepID=A0A1H3TD05_9ACTN|nr:DUF1622 domain-containing protein [Asanoa ishikariensis]GIF62651.1 hypothetical protein Ais01nite_06860 [Asanoa ishikariensis]SDZ48183.1 Uncharacterized membrane protein [Asanoa ishikariensis]